MGGEDVKCEDEKSTITHGMGVLDIECSSECHRHYARSEFDWWRHSALLLVATQIKLRAFLTVTISSPTSLLCMHKEE
jgi:hypothetical protein